MASALAGIAACGGGGASSSGGSSGATAAPVTPTAAVAPVPPKVVVEAAPSDAGIVTAPSDASTGSGATAPEANDASPPAAAARNAVDIGPNDNGKTVTAKKGQDIVVALPGNPTTGYEWIVSKVDKTLGQPTGAYAATSTAPGIVGGGGAYTFTWSGKSPLDLRGTHDVELQYKRSFEQTAVKTFKVKIKIVD